MNQFNIGIRTTLEKDSTCKICNKKAMKMYNMNNDNAFTPYYVCGEKQCCDVMNGNVLSNKIKCSLCANIIELLYLYVWGGSSGQIIFPLCSLKCSKEYRKMIKSESKKINHEHKIVCAYCHVAGYKFRKCSKCGIIFYCSKECQIADWKKEHKEHCKKMGLKQNENRDKTLVKEQDESKCRICKSDSTRIYNCLITGKRVSLISICDKRDCEENILNYMCLAGCVCSVCCTHIDRSKLRMHSVVIRKLSVVTVTMWITCSSKCLRQSIDNSRKIADGDEQINYICDYCGKRGIDHKSCAKCLITYYCSHECQVADWKSRHKEQCKEYKKE